MVCSSDSQLLLESMSNMPNLGSVTGVSHIQLQTACAFQGCPIGQGTYGGHLHAAAPTCLLFSNKSGIQSSTGSGSIASSFCFLSLVTALKIWKSGRDFRPIMCYRTRDKEARASFLPRCPGTCAVALSHFVQPTFRLHPLHSRPIWFLEFISAAVRCVCAESNIL